VDWLGLPPTAADLNDGWAVEEAFVEEDIIIGVVVVVSEFRYIKI
jgi:hypothetical protein